MLNWMGESYKNSEKQAVSPDDGVATGGVKNACPNYAGLRRMQAQKLHYNQKQKNHTGQNRIKQILQILQKTYGPQRNKIGTLTGVRGFHVM
jgi:transcriptional accessory protein Tex/SPT6